ncbi:MAG: hypothetical protein ACJA01_004054 [Saprospiraceae bacterium]|jgi:hypothetical protein
MPVAITKKESTPIEGALKSVMNVNAFSYKSAKGTSGFTFDMEELKRYMPEVIVDTDYDVESSPMAPGKTTLPGIKISAFTPVIIEAMKEQQEGIYLLKSMIADLKIELESIKNEIKSSNHN